MPSKITTEYLHALQATYHQIDKRGILINPRRLAEASDYITTSITSCCTDISNTWGIHCYIGASNKPDKDVTSINLNSSSGSNTPLAFLKSLGYKIPTVSSKDEDGNYIAKESLNELVLQKIFAINEKNITGGDPAIRALLKIRELVTLKNRYINANLYKHSSGDSFFLSNYNCVGTVTGRRGSRKHSFGFGGNAQNFPKHGELAKIYRRCLVARPGKIFLMVDQIQAEDWPTSCLANNTEALHDLLTGVDRHRKLACLIFDLPWDHYNEQDWKDSLERYLGKKCRHANNYGMRGNTMSDSLAKEGHSLTPQQCQFILDKVNQVDPSVDKVFHQYIKDCLYANRTLRTPTGRERIFFGLRNGEKSNNNKIFNEAYSYIPQSTVGDNTGFAVYYLEREFKRRPGFIIQEGHDSIVQEVDDSVDAIWDHIQECKEAFNRKFVFYNGLEVIIPIEGELGYDFAHTETLKNIRTKAKKLDELSYSDLQAAYYKLQETREKQIENATTPEQELDHSLL